MKKILIFIDWFVPGYKAGGPIQSVFNLVNHLCGDYEFFIVTSNKDLGEADPYPDVPYNRWIKKDNYQVIYLDKQNQQLKKYRELFKERDYHAVYFNSLFSVNFALKPLLLVVYQSNIKVVLAPRGMLGAGALQIKKRKKAFFLKLFKLLGISQKIIWHATADTEAAEIRKQFGAEVKIKMATNLSSVIPSDPVAKNKAINQLELFFLSRVSPKKNLKAALTYLQRVKKECRISFSIIGPLEDALYWEECKKLIVAMPEHIQVEYIGAVPHHLLKEKLKDKHFMLLPTFHENFGHVIMEAWQNGSPVIISNNTPWRDLEANLLGFDFPLEEEAPFIQAIETAAAMEQETFKKWSLASFNFAKDYTNNPEALQASRELFV